MYAPGTVVSPHASHAPMSWRAILGAVHVSPSPCHAKVPVASGVVSKYVARYVEVAAFVTLTDHRAAY